MNSTRDGLPATQGNDADTSGADIECAISLKEAARRHEIGFRLPGCSAWRVWPSRLAELSQPRPRVARLDGGPSRESDLLPRGRAAFVDSVLRARQASKELDELLARATSGRSRKN